MALVCLMVSSNIGLAQGKDYENHWAENSIQSWVDKGYVKGYADGSFKPEGDITRAEFISIVNRSFGFTEQADKDMPAHKVGKLWKFKISEIDQWIIKGDAADKARDNFTHLVKYHELLPGLLV